MGKRKKKKIFVLDTSVILHDHSAIYAFEENDIAIPISVLEELDTFKKGNDNKNYEAREFTRCLDELSQGGVISNWLSRGRDDLGKFTVVMEEKSTPDACQIFGENKADHRILNVAIKLRDEFKTKDIILVSKDINLRIKAKSLQINAEDYKRGQVRETSHTYKGKTELTDIPSEKIDTIYNDGSIHYKEITENKPLANHYYILKNGKSSALVVFNEESESFVRIEKRSAYGIKPRNAEQVFALNALLDPKIKLVTLAGVAGTGKTLIALSSALEQKKDFRQIFLARPIVPLSNKDIGYLPGDIKSKLNPYMEPLWDNLKYIQSQFKETEQEYKKITQMVEQEKLVISPLAYIRGRSLSNIIFIVDEAQNLTPHEVKTIITRAGENTKFIFTGDVRQIDSPYLDAHSNGLSYLIDRMHGQELHAHVTLEKGERSELANIANDLL